MEIIWTPTAEVLEDANVVRLMQRVGIDDYHELQRRSAEDPEWFWPAAIDDMGLEFSQPFDRVVDLSRGPEWATWFVGGKLNLAWNCVHRWAERTPEVAAALWESEDGERHGLTYRELSARVTRFAEALVALGVEPGDRVAFFLPMSPEVSIVSHACAHIGAVQVPVFSGFAAPAVAQRLQDSEAKVVVTADGSLRRGREVPMKEIVDDAVRESPSVEHVVVWRRLGRDDVPMTPRRDLFDAEVMEGPGTLEPLQVDSEHPYLLTYTSGTTGRPKGVVHVQGGFLVSIAREVAYQADAKPGEVVHFVTDMGWIMGPWEVVGGNALGCTVLFAEGAPDWPAADRLWSLVERERIAVLGLSPTLTRALVPHGRELVERHDLSSLRVLVTTGEPWNPEPYRWLHEVVGGERCPIINCSGGTEVGACFLSPTVAEPIKACSLGGPALGMAMDVVDAEGRSVEPGAVRLAAGGRGGGAVPDHQLLGREGGGRVLPLADRRRADQGVLTRRPGARDGDGRRRRGGAIGARRGRRARLPQAVSGHDARLLARPAAVPRHVLEPLAGRLGARRLGVGRRGRLLVPA